MDDDTYQKEGLLLTCEPHNATETVTVTIDDKVVTLDATEANDLLEWLYQRRDIFFQLEHSGKSL